MTCLSCFSFLEIPEKPARAPAFVPLVSALPPTEGKLPAPRLLEESGLSEAEVCCSVSAINAKLTLPELPESSGCSDGVEKSSASQSPQRAGLSQPVLRCYVPEVPTVSSILPESSQSSRLPAAAMPSQAKSSAPDEDEDFELARLCSAFDVLEKSRSPRVLTANIDKPAQASSLQHSSTGGFFHESLAEEVPSPGQPIVQCVEKLVAVPQALKAVVTPPTASAPTSRALSGCSTPTETTASVGRGTTTSPAMELWPAGVAATVSSSSAAAVPFCSSHSSTWGQPMSRSSRQSFSPTSSSSFQQSGRLSGERMLLADGSMVPEHLEQRLRETQMMEDWFNEQLAEMARSETFIETPEHWNTPSPKKAEPPKAFRLDVQLSDAMDELHFTVDDDIEAVCRVFIVENRLKEFFLQPLVAHVESMVQSDKRIDTVDIIDLI